MKNYLFVFSFLVILLVIPMSDGQAIPTGYAANPGHEWYAVLNFGTSDLATGAVFRVDVKAVHQLAQRGIRIAVGVNIWDGFPTESVLICYAPLIKYLLLYPLAAWR